MFFWFNQDTGSFDWYKDRIALVPEFAEVMGAQDLGPLVMKWIAAMYDTRSPYFHMEEKDRLKKTCVDIFKKKSIPFNITDARVNAAASLYKEMYLDSDLEQYRVYELTINRLVKRMGENHGENEKDRAELMDISNSLNSLNKQKKELHKTLLERERNGEVGNPNLKVKGGKELTLWELISSGHIDPEEHAGT